MPRSRTGYRRRASTALSECTALTVSSSRVGAAASVAADLVGRRARERVGQADAARARTRRSRPLRSTGVPGDGCDVGPVHRDRPGGVGHDDAAVRRDRETTEQANAVLGERERPERGHGLERRSVRVVGRRLDDRRPAKRPDTSNCACTSSPRAFTTVRATPRSRTRAFTNASASALLSSGTITEKAPPVEATSQRPNVPPPLCSTRASSTMPSSSTIRPS